MLFKKDSVGVGTGGHGSPAGDPARKVSSSTFTKFKSAGGFCALPLLCVCFIFKQCQFLKPVHLHYVCLARFPDSIMRSDSLTV